MIRLAVEEFKARRRTAQQRIEDAFRPLAERALDGKTNTDGWNELLNEVAHQWRLAYTEESGHTGPGMPRALRLEIHDALKHTDKAGRTEATVDRIITWLATAVLSHATLTAADDDPEELFVEWTAMNDDHVREAHRQAAGQQRPIGVMFEVGDKKMPYPGWSGVPIELWINCRCTLRPVLASEVNSMTASDFRDVPPAERKKDAGEGRAMPDGSYPIDNCGDLKNAIQAIGRAKDPGKVKAHIKRRKSSLGCPDVSIPEDWSGAVETFVPDEANPPDPSKRDDPFEHATPEISDTTLCVVALPAADDPVNELAAGVEGGVHATLIYFGEVEDPTAVAMAVEEYLATDAPEPFTVEVTGIDNLGDDEPQATVWKLATGDSTLEQIRSTLLGMDAIREPYAAIKQWPTFTPHVTIGYGLTLSGDGVDALSGVEQITFDRLAVWHGSDHAEYPLGEAMTAADTKPDDPPVDEITDTPDATDSAPLEQVAVPWHGVLAPEGVASGDGRGFKQNSLTTRPLPLPLGWQKTSDEGHLQNVVVAKIERAEMVDGEMRGAGTFLMIPEADEAIGMVAEFGRFGVSVDADDADFEFDDSPESDGVVWFTKARVAGAVMVSIPAFHEAYVSLGEAPEDFFGGTPVTEEEVPESEALVASGFWKQFVDVAPGVTEDGPGWLTHPVDTDRLRDYWVRGEGAAKIGWGSPGDFNRCRLNLAEYIKPEFLSGYCANRHKDALGVWPGQEASARDTMEDTEMAQSINLVASAVPTHAPAEWFRDPEFAPDDGRLVAYKNGTYGCPQTITEDGQVYGHIATWKECHSSYGQARCILAPHSSANYAHFLLGEVLTTEGAVPCGSLTVGGSHADLRLGLAEARAHYDNSCAAYADVNVGEDEYGIWFAGWVRPGTPPEMIHAARASKLSGDWRRTGGGQELVAALAVNVPGFQVPRVAASVQNGVTLALVAAGALAPEESVTVPYPFDVEKFARAVVDEIESRKQREYDWSQFKRLVESGSRYRVDAMRALAAKAGL